MSKVQHGTSGGIDLLDKHDRLVPDRELAELTEPLNDRIEDQLSSALQAVTRQNPGGYVTNKQFAISHEGMRDTDITFTRYYWTLNLLVDMIGEPMNEQDRLANIAHVESHRLFAHSVGAKYLPIIGGASLGEIESALK